MSIDQLIIDLTLALDRNTVALENAAGCAAKPVKEKKTKEPVQPAAAATVATPAPVAAVVAQPVAQPDGLDTKTVADAVIKLANEHSRDAAVSILAKVRGADKGVTRVSDLNPAHYTDIMAEVDAAMKVAIAAQSNASLV
jgi:hypothetical protein